MRGTGQLGGACDERMVRCRSINRGSLNYLPDCLVEGPHERAIHLFEGGFYFRRGGLQGLRGNLGGIKLTGVPDNRLVTVFPDILQDAVHRLEVFFSETEIPAGNLLYPPARGP